MQLYVLAKSPITSATLLPEKYRFVLLKELLQMMSSVLGGRVVDERLYKKIPQGKEIQDFISKNREWAYKYAIELFKWNRVHTKLKVTTIRTFDDILCLWLCSFDSSEFILLKEAPFRYHESYSCSIPTKTVLPVDKCIEEYTKYLHWKLSK